MARLRSMCALLLLVPVAASAEDKGPRPAPDGGPDPMLFAPPSVDQSATGWSCTADTLISGVECVFESEAQPAADAARQAKENGDRAREVAVRACAHVSRLPNEAKPDKELKALCEKSFVETAAECGEDGTLPLFDAQGRFAPTLRPCYQALAEVVRKTRLMAAVSIKCCRCLTKNRCAASTQECNDDVVQGEVDAAAWACIDQACRDACGAAVPKRPKAGAVPAEQRRRGSPAGLKDL